MLDAVNILGKQPTVAESDYGAHPGFAVVAVKPLVPGVPEFTGVLNQLSYRHRVLPNLGP